MQAQNKARFSMTFGFYEQGRVVRRETLAQEVIKVGSDPRSHLRIDEEGVSRMQAVIEAASPDKIMVIDLGNEAGTWVNGTRINKCAIAIGDEIRIGQQRIRLECVENTLSTTSAAPIDPFGSRDRFAVSENLAPEDCAYALVKSGPEVNVDEVEIRHVASVEVAILWGTTVLHVQHLTPPRSFYVGEEEGKNFGCDYLIPSEKMGTTRAPVVLVHEGLIDFVIPPRSSGYVEVPGERRLSLEEAIRTGRALPCSEWSGAYQMTLGSGAKARVEVGDLVFQIGAVAAGKPVPRGILASMESGRHMYTGFSFLAHSGLFAAMAFFVPPIGLVEAEGLSRDRQYLIQQYLQAAAEREQEAKATDQPATADADDREGGTGTRAAGEEGSMGTPQSRETNRKYSVKGPSEATDTHLARATALREAGEFGLIGLLNGGAGGDPKAPTAPWGRDESLGTDAENHLGNMWGDTVGDAFGLGGLGLTGIGEGGGGRGEGIGLTNIAGLGLGHGSGLGTGDGIGNGHGHLGKGHTTHVPVMHVGQTVINGRLPPEIIQRIVRQNYGRFRLCYENGLRGNPSLQGRVSVRFAIGRDGAVSNVMNGGSDLPDASVVQCVIRAYYGLTFPQPEGGIVTVVYPIMFTPGE